jgi:hypothetical protein
MRFFSQIIGLALLVVGVYFLGQNILFTTAISRYWWSDVSATGSILALTAGIASLVFFPRQVGSFGWVLVGLGIILVFISGKVVLLPTSLWYFFLSFTALALGLRLLTTGRINF